MDISLRVANDNPVFGNYIYTIEVLAGDDADAAEESVELEVSVALRKGQEVPNYADGGGTLALVSLTKSQARALGSALMGAAAEVAERQAEERKRQKP